MGYTIQELEDRNRIKTELSNYATAHNKPKPTAEELDRLMRFITTREHQLSKINCDFCNKDMSPKEYDKVMQKRNKLRQSVNNYIQPMIGCEIRFNGDPRGQAIRLCLKDQSTNWFFNSWDGETTGITW